MDAQLQRAWREFISSTDSQFAMTLNFNRGITLRGAREKFRNYLARLNRRLFGPRWSQRPALESVQAIAIAEHLNSNLHFHVAARLPPDKMERFHEIVEPVWRGLVPGGDAHIVPVSYLPGWAWYMTKSFYDRADLENVVIAAEFFSN